MNTPFMQAHPDITWTSDETIRRTERETGTYRGFVLWAHSDGHFNVFGQLDGIGIMATGDGAANNLEAAKWAAIHATDKLIRYGIQPDREMKNG